MADILIFIIIPVILVTVFALWKINSTNKIADSVRLEDRVEKVSKRPRVIRDKNHKLFEMNKLMLPENEKSFDDDIQNLVEKSINVPY